MASFFWTCKACGQSVETHMHACTRCACPKKATDTEIERYKKSHSSPKDLTQLPLLPIRKTIREAIFIVWDNRYLLVPLLMIPAILLVMINLFFEQIGEDNGLTRLSFDVSYYAVFTLFAIPIHRMILVGEVNNLGSRILTWKIRETRFFIWSLIILYLPVFIAGIVFTPIVVFWDTIYHSDLTFFLVLVFCAAVIFLGLYLLARISLIFPTIAIDYSSVDIVYIWHISRRNGWSLAVVIMLFPVILGIGIGFTFNHLFPLAYHPPMVRHGIVSFFYVLIGILEVAVLSVSFRRLSSRNYRTGDA